MNVLPLLRGWAATLLLVLSVLSLPTQMAKAATPPWPESSYAYFADGEPLPTVLRAFADTFGVRLQVSPYVQGQVNGRFFAPTPSDFLDRLANAYGFVWYYYGGVLHVNAAQEVVRRSLTIPQGNVGELKEALINLGIFEPRFGWGEFPDRGLVIVSGPPPYVDLVAQTLSALPTRSAPTATMAVFRLKHASAEDRTFYYRDKEVTIPGVATILRKLASGEGDTGSRTRQWPLGGGGRGVLGTGVPNLYVVPQPVPGAPTQLQPQAEEALRAQPPRQADADIETVIQSDPRLNAVVIKDIPERVEAYGQLIAALDVPVALIEIEATVVDVATDRMAELGIRWRGAHSNVRGGFGTIEDARPDDSTLALAVGKNLSLSTILSDTGNYFLGKISALEADGDARVLSRPSVLTIDNLEAVLDLSETFYIRVSGERVAEVVQVSAGVLLKVTPHLVTDGNGANRIQLVVDIEDGEVQPDRKVDNLPTVRRSTISTQAVVGENESLLIGGYYFENETKEQNKVPLLGDIPVLGLLFKQDSSKFQKRERLFMITPKIVQLPGLDKQ